MSELALIIDEMITCGEGIVKATKELTACGEQMIQSARKLRELFSTENLPEPKALTANEALPTKEEAPIKTYSKEEVRGILAGKSAKVMEKRSKLCFPNMVRTSSVP